MPSTISFESTMPFQECDKQKVQFKLLQENRKIWLLVFKPLVVEFGGANHQPVAKLNSNSMQGRRLSLDSFQILVELSHGMMSRQTGSQLLLAAALMRRNE